VRTVDSLGFQRVGGFVAASGRPFGVFVRPERLLPVQD